MIIVVDINVILSFFFKEEEMRVTFTKFAPTSQVAKRHLLLRPKSRIYMEL